MDSLDFLLEGFINQECYLSIVPFNAAIAMVIARIVPQPPILNHTEVFRPTRRGSTVRMVRTRNVHEQLGGFKCSESLSYMACSESPLSRSGDEDSAVLVYARNEPDAMMVKLHMDKSY